MNDQQCSVKLKLTDYEAGNRSLLEYYSSSDRMIQNRSTDLKKVKNERKKNKNLNYLKFFL